MTHPGRAARMALAAVAWSAAVGCASTHTSGGGPAMLASLQPEAAAPAPRAVTRLPEDSPAGLLGRGFKRFDKGDFDGAMLAFAAALGTGQLNDAGRALAYWQIAMAERQLGREDGSMEALSSFVVVGEEMLQEGRALPETGGFADSFGLPRRLAEARAFLSAAWARRVPEFGRSLENWIPVHSEDEIDQFLGLAAPCVGAPDRRVVRAPLPEGEGRRLERVTVSCASRQMSEDFFLRLVRGRAQALGTAPRL